MSPILFCRLNLHSLVLWKGKVVDQIRKTTEPKVQVCVQCMCVCACMRPCVHVCICVCVFYVQHMYTVSVWSAKLYCLICMFLSACINLIQSCQIQTAMGNNTPPIHSFDSFIQRSSVRFRIKFCLISSSGTRFCTQIKRDLLPK